VRLDVSEDAPPVARRLRVVSSRATGSGLASQRFQCGACGGLTYVEPDSDAFWCHACGSDNSFRECLECRGWSVVAAPYGLPVSGWTCETCSRVNAVGRAGRLPVTLNGFVVVSSRGNPVMAGCRCSITAREDGIEVRVAARPVVAAYPYEELDAIELGGRTRLRAANGSSGRRPRGARATDATVTLVRGRETLQASSGEHSLARLRTAFADALDLWDAARGASSCAAQSPFDNGVGELSRLSRMHEEGAISSAEFHIVRVLILRRMTGRSRA